MLNLIREFEMQRMKESETVKEYADRLLSIVNRVRLLGTELSDDRMFIKFLLLSLKDLKQQSPHWRILRICQVSPWQNC